MKATLNTSIKKQPKLSTEELDINSPNFCKTQKVEVKKLTKEIEEKY